MTSDPLISDHAHKRYHMKGIFLSYNCYKSCNLIANDDEVMTLNVQ